MEKLNYRLLSHAYFQRWWMVLLGSRILCYGVLGFTSEESYVSFHHSSVVLGRMIERVGWKE